MTEKTIDELMEECRSSDPDAQGHAMRLLQEREAYEAAPTILLLLQSSEEWVRRVAADILGDLGQDHLDRVGPALLNALDDPEHLVRDAAVESLGALGYRPAID